MEWFIIDQHTTTRIVETEVISQFKDWLMKNKIKCKVGLRHCDPIFWLTSEERSKLTGPIGLVGCAGPTTSISKEVWESSRPIAKERDICIDITLEIPDSVAQLLQTKKFKLTPNYVGGYIKLWDVSPIKHMILERYGIYKKNGFDEALNAMKVLKPYLNEEQFAKEEHDGCGGYGCYSKDDWDWDLELVDEKLYDGPEKCISSYERNRYVETGKSTVNLSLLAIDLENNIDCIQELLLSHATLQQ